MNMELVNALKSGATLVDVRTVSEYQGGTVPGAINIPLNELPSKLETLDKNRQIVVFCQSGNRSGQALYFLEKNGFGQVYNGGGWFSLKAIVESL